MTEKKCSNCKYKERRKNNLLEVVNCPCYDSKEDIYSLINNYNNTKKYFIFNEYLCLIKTFGKKLIEEKKN